MRGTLATFVTCLACVTGVWATDIHGVSMDGLIEKTVSLRTHSIAAPYVDTDLQNRWWDFGEDAIVNTNKHVRLTQDRPSQKGWLWSRMPLATTSWQIEVEFKVEGKAHNLFGDGFAMWIAKDRGTSGPVFGSVDYFNGLGIFFDTYANSRHSYSWPRITAMMGDGKTGYDHAKDGEANEVAACSENFRRRDIATKARLTYFKGQTLLLELQNKEVDKWTSCFELNATLPDSPFIGFSAATGDVSDNHDIVSVQTNSIILQSKYRDSPKAQAPMGAKTGAPLANKPARSPKSKSGGGAAGWFLFILKLIGVGAFIAFAVAAVRTYNAQKKSKRAW